MDLLNDTKKLLKESDKTLEQVHVGAGVSYHWLAKFKRNAINDPSVNKVQDLYNFLRNDN